MNAERWREIKSIFDAAADLQAQEQAAFVHSSAGEDRELEAEVLRLLRANASTDGLHGEARRRFTYLYRTCSR